MRLLTKVPNGHKLHYCGDYRSVIVAYNCSVLELKKLNEWSILIVS